MASIGTIYQAKKANSLANPITNAVPFVQTDDVTKATAVFFPQVTGTTSAAFRVRARGRSTTGTSGNFACSLQFGTSILAATNTVVCAPTTATNAANCSWFIEATFIWDATTQKLANVFMANNASTPAIIIQVEGTAVSTVDLSTGTTNAIVAAALFGTSNAGNIAYLDELTMEVL